MLGYEKVDVIAVTKFNLKIDCLIAAHLLSASVMSAPAALACAKLLYPEMEESHLSAEEIR